MKNIIILILPFLFSGCLYVNDRGIDTNYYNSCTEYYDSMGNYHKVCDTNIGFNNNGKKRVEVTE